MMTSRHIRSRFARRVVELRDERRWTQEELAANSGISTRSVSNIENCVYGVTIDTVGKLADGFDVHARDLFDFQ